MAKSIYIPLDIIDNVITAVGEDTRLLKQCALVSTSFLYLSRKRLFSKLSIRSDQTCRGIHQFLIQNPIIQSFVRSITLTEVINGWGSKFPEWMNDRSLLAILRLPFVCLECFSIIVSRDNWTRTPTSWDWNSSSSELKDAVSNIIHSSTLKSFSLSGIARVPITFFNHIVHLTTLELRSISLYDFGDDNSSSLTQAASNEVASMASHSAIIDRCVWRIEREDAGYYITTESTFLPFMCRLRFLEIYVGLDYKSMANFTILSHLMASLCTRLTSPATLEHLELNIRYHNSIFEFDSNTFYARLRHVGVWSHLDAITTHPTGSRLQRVDVNITISSRFREEVDEDLLLKAVFDKLPLLRSKGILFVKVARPCQ